MKYNIMDNIPSKTEITVTDSLKCDDKDNISSETKITGHRYSRIWWGLS